MASRKKWEKAECKIADNETWSQFAARRFENILTWHKEIVGYGNGVYFLGENASLCSSGEVTNHVTVIRQYCKYSAWCVYVRACVRACARDVM